MKKEFLVLALAVALCGHTHAQQAKLTVVKGSYDKERKHAVALFSVKEGEKQLYATTVVDDNNGYAFAITDCREGFYYLGDTLKREFTRVYLKPGDQLTVNLGDKDKSEMVSGSAENKVLFDWQNLCYAVAYPASTLGDTSTYESFFPNLTALLPKADAFNKKINTPNASFNKLMRMTTAFDMQRWALRFLMIPHTKHPTVDQYPPYYKEIVANNLLGSTQILKVGEATDYISLYVGYNMMQSYRNIDKDSISKISQQQRVSNSLAYIANDTLKGLYLSNTLGNYRTYENLTETVEPRVQYLVTPSMKEKYFLALKRVNTFRKGSPAFNFKYPDTNGKDVSLADLKGKVVVVDIWATWCGPCKKELPYLKTLEEEMRDNPNVAFVSISVDEEKDREKWSAFVKDQSLGGIQLYGKGWSDIVKFYNVTGIPRFMVFDKEGKIVSVDAPRPSTPELKAMVESLM